MSVVAADVAAPRSTTVGRREYLDWLRGVAVLIMIEAHVIDSWTRVADRTTKGFYDSVILGGFGAPLFLFLAGVAVALSAGSKLRRSGSAIEAAHAVRRRGLEIFALAFLFRIQAWILGGSTPWYLFKVDILNIMGPSIVAAAMLWGLANTAAARMAIFAAATAGIACVTPYVRSLAIVAALPDPIEAYINPVPSLTNFTFFPWAGLLFAGGFVGVALEGTREKATERRMNYLFLCAGTIVAGVAYWLSYRPTPFPGSRFWTTSPAFFFIRVGVMTAAIGIAYLWDLRPRARVAWSPLRQLGRTSLFIYWIHVEMVYGVISLPLRKALSLGGAWIALEVFCLFMLICSVLKDRLVSAWQKR
jgi:uncharacterized membrane protein